MSNNDIGVLILAAGKGTRMYSNEPKVLQEILGEPMLNYVYSAAKACFGNKVWTIVGHKQEMVRAAFPDEEDRFIVQKELLGTGHALQTAWPTLANAGLKHVLVLSGDVPLLSADMIKTFVTAMQRTTSPLGFISLTLPSSGAYGRVIRERNEVVGIVEAKDYSSVVHGPDKGEINTGIYLINVDKIGPLLPLLSNQNNSGEYYITDLIDLAVKAGMEVIGSQCGDRTLLGVNNPAELVHAEEILRKEIIHAHLVEGAGIHFSESVVLGPKVVLAPGARIMGPCSITGKTVVESGAKVESFCMVKNSHIGRNSLVRNFSHLDGASVSEDCVVGPYARLRPETVLGSGARIGNFVEIKKSVLAEGAKVNHLSYVGDATVGPRANIGAGTVTCNYDGKNKYITEIGEDSFIGSNSSLIAPVTIGKKSTVAAGSTITENVPESTVAFGRARQVNKSKK